MRISECGLAFPLFGKRRKSTQNSEKPAIQYLQPAPHQNQVGIVGDECAGRAKVDERLRCRGDVAESMNMRHHIVSESTLVCSDLIEVDVVEMGAHLLDCFRRNCYAELTLRFG